MAGAAVAVALALAFGGLAAASSVSRLDLVRFVDDRTAFAAASVVCGLARRAPWRRRSPRCCSAPPVPAVVLAPCASECSPAGATAPG